MHHLGPAFVLPSMLVRLWLLPSPRILSALWYTISIYQKTINKIIFFYDFSFINSYLLTASNKYLRYAIFNKPYLFIYCSSFVETFLKITELTQRQFINIFKAYIIAFIQTVQTVLINDINNLLTIQRSPINILLNRYYIHTTWYKKNLAIFQKL